MNREDVCVIDVPPSGRPRCRWFAALAGLAVILVVPFALIDVPPVLDYPNHLARYFVLAHPGDVILSKMYQPHWAILPNLAMDILGALALRITDVHIGGRILLALSLLAPIFGVVIYHRVIFRRSFYWPLASGLIAYNGIFFLGFMNFLLSLGLALIGGAAWIFLNRMQYFWTRIAVGAFATVLIFFSHIFGVILFALLIGGDEIDRLRKVRSFGRLSAREVVNAAAAILASLAPAFLLYFLSPLDNAATALADWRGMSKVWRIFTPFMTTSFELTLLTVFVILAALILARRKVAFAPGMPLIFAALFIAFIAAPSTIKSGTFIDGRFALMMGLLLFAGMQPHWTACEAAVTSSAIAALILVRSIYVGATWIDHRRDLDDLRAAIAHVQPGSLVLVARGQPGYLTDVRPQERALPGIYRLDGHLAALLVIERKAFWPLLFANPIQQPLIVKPPFDRIAQPLSEPVEWDALATETPTRESLRTAPYLDNWRNNFDSVLLIDPPSKIADLEDRSPVYQGGYARLYSLNHRKPD
jgi:hypothetical protein